MEFFLRALRNPADQWMFESIRPQKDVVFNETLTRPEEFAAFNSMFSAMKNSKMCDFVNCSLACFGAAEDMTAEDFMSYYDNRLNAMAAQLKLRQRDRTDILRDPVLSRITCSFPVLLRKVIEMEDVYYSSGLSYLTTPHQAMENLILLEVGLVALILVGVVFPFVLIKHYDIKAAQEALDFIDEYSYSPVDEVQL